VFSKARSRNMDTDSLQIKHTSRRRLRDALHPGRGRLLPRLSGSVTPAKQFALLVIKERPAP
jgi:hypothetical protein